MQRYGQRLQKLPNRSAQQAPLADLEDGGRRARLQRRRARRRRLALQLVRQADEAVAAAPWLHRLQGACWGSVEGSRSAGGRWAAGGGALRECACNACGLPPAVNSLPGGPAAAPAPLTCPGAMPLAGALPDGRRCERSEGGGGPRRPLSSGPADGARSMGDTDRRSLAGSGWYPMAPSCLAFFMAAPWSPTGPQGPGAERGGVQELGRPPGAASGAWWDCCYCCNAPNSRGGA